MDSENYKEILRHAMRKDFTYSESDHSSDSDFKPKGKIAAMKNDKIKEANNKLDDKIESEQKLRDIYYNVNTGYRSAEKLYQEAKKENINVTRNAVSRWLKNSRTYSRFKPIKKNRYRKTVVDYLGEQLQLDLISMQKYNYKNGGYNWILSGIEILSRFGFTVPVKRKTTKDMTNAVKMLLRKYKDRFGVFPKNIQFDEGKEFYNVGVKMLLKRINKINYFSTQSDKKAAVVERLVV